MGQPLFFMGLTREVIEITLDEHDRCPFVALPEVRSDSEPDRDPLVCGELYLGTPSLLPGYHPYG